MQLNQIVQWTLLPNELTQDGQLAASVFVAPRLRGEEGATLADFTDFADWPAQIRALELTLQRDDGNVEAPLQIIREADSELWHALFPPKTPVKPFAFDDFADRPIASFPFLGVLDHFRERWASLAAQSIDGLPIATQNASPIGPALNMEEPGGPILSDHFRELRRANRTGLYEGAKTAQQLSDRMEDSLRAAAARAAALRQQHNLVPQSLITPFGAPDSAAGNLYSLSMFHRRPIREPATFPPTPEEADAEIAERMEFHRLLSSLGDHPALLRRLGLVIDLIIRPDFVPQQSEADQPVGMRVLVNRPSAFPPKDIRGQTPWNVDVTPWTQARLSLVEGSAFFTAAERQPVRRLAHGFLRLDPGEFAAVAVDVDGLALKALNMASTLDTQETNTSRPVEEPATAGVPLPRTGGLALVRRGYAEALHSEFYVARAHNDTLETLDPDHPPVLAAEDLVRGFLMDIFDDRSGRWRSLHQRTVTYTAVRYAGGPIDVEDEGAIQTALAGEVDRPDAPADPDGTLYAHEALFTWDGWSLAAKRPEVAILQEPAVLGIGQDFGPLGLKADITARPASLPALRFGSGYRIRVRTVDLAGNALELERANNVQELFEAIGDANYVVAVPSEPTIYRRFEPLPPPELVPRRHFGPGEGVERLVIRSNFDMSAQDYAARSEASPEAMFRYVPFCERHVAPPKASLQLAEQHGMFDEALRAARGLSVDDAMAATQEFYAIAARESGSFRNDPAAYFVATGEHRGEPQGYAVVDADEIDLPYLPDPITRGAALRIEFEPWQASNEYVLDYPVPTRWPYLSPLRLRLVTGDLASAGSADGRLFEVSLPPGRTARLTINSLPDWDPEFFGIVDWCRNKLHRDDADRVAEAVRAGRHWMTTPWRTIDLIHAVQQPLEAPIMKLRLEAYRTFHRFENRSDAALFGAVFLDVPSTARIDLLAQWDDVVDDGKTDQGSLTRTTRTTVFSFALPEPFGTPWFGDVSDLLSLESPQDVRFATAPGNDWRTVEEFRRYLLAQSSLAPTVQERNRLAAAASQIAELNAHEFADTRWRRVDYQMIASTRFREYFDPQMPIADGQRSSNIETVEMLSSAKPKVPVVIDVVPLFGWTEEGAIATGLTSTRHGRGLRVWLARPWFDSGEGEMLGLVCSAEGTVGVNSPHYREVTYIARDPMHDGAVPLPLRKDAFTIIDASVDNLTIKTQLGDSQLDVVAFHPKYDERQDAWYCDLRFDTGNAYFPFVRLGLVRYQPKSIKNCETSRIAPTYFIQTLPDRYLTITASDAATFAVKLRGPAPTSRVRKDGIVEPGTNIVVAAIEFQEPHIADPDIGWITGHDVELDAQMDASGTAVWSGEIVVPDGLAGPLRLAVREYEVLPTDDRVSQPPAIEDSRRLVYVDTVLLD